MSYRIKIQGGKRRNERGGWKDKDNFHLSSLEYVDTLPSSTSEECVFDCMIQASLTNTHDHSQGNSLCPLVNYGQVVN